MQAIYAVAMFAALFAVAAAERNERAQSQFCQERCQEQGQQQDQCQRECNRCYAQKCFTAQQFNCEQEPTGKQCQNCAEKCFDQYNRQGNNRDNQQQMFQQQMPSMCFQKCTQNSKQPGFCQAQCFQCYMNECYQKSNTNCQQNPRAEECQNCAQNCAKQFYSATSAEQMPFCQFQCQQNAKENAQECQQNCNRCYGENCAQCGSNQRPQECQQCAQNCAKRFFSNSN